MKALEDKILCEGKIMDGGVLKVGGFLNQRIDVQFVSVDGQRILCRMDGIDTVFFRDEWFHSQNRLSDEIYFMNFSISYFAALCNRNMGFSRKTFEKPLDRRGLMC